MCDSPPTAIKCGGGGVMSRANVGCGDGVVGDAHLVEQPGACGDTKVQECADVVANRSKVGERHSVVFMDPSRELDQHVVVVVFGVKDDEPVWATLGRGGGDTGGGQGGGGHDYSLRCTLPRTEGVIGGLDRHEFALSAKTERSGGLI